MYIPQNSCYLYTPKKKKKKTVTGSPTITFFLLVKEEDPDTPVVNFPLTKVVDYCGFRYGD